MAKMVDLGREPECMAMPEHQVKMEKKMHYPSLYISGVKDLELSTGDIEFTAKGRVISVTDRGDGKYSCEIEVHKIGKVEGNGSEGGLEEALEKISKKKGGY